jgi:hypothetical protein
MECIRDIFTERETVFCNLRNLGFTALSGSAQVLLLKSTRETLAGL